MKFRRQVSELQIIVIDECLPEVQKSWVATCWQRTTKSLASKSFWDAVLKWATGSSEPMIENYQDSHGNTVYRVYDPHTQQQVEHLSEAEVRIWLEQRYYS